MDIIIFYLKRIYSNMKLTLKFPEKRVEMEGFWRDSAIFQMFFLRVYFRNQ